MQKFKETDNKFLLGFIDMITSILIISVLTFYIKFVLSPNNIKQLLIDEKKLKLAMMLNDEFVEEVIDGTIIIDTLMDHLEIKFRDGLLFPPSSASLNYDGKKIVGKLFSKLNQKEYLSDFKEIQVEGHTDSSLLNSEEYPRNNWELSTARALSCDKTIHQGT